MVPVQYRAQIKTYSANIDRYNRIAMKHVRRQDYPSAISAYGSISENINHIKDCFNKIERANKPVEEEPNQPNLKDRIETRTEIAGTVLTKESAHHAPYPPDIESIAGADTKSQKPCRGFRRTPV